MPQAIATAVVSWLGVTGTAATVLTAVVQLGAGLLISAVTQPRPSGGQGGEPRGEPQDGSVLFTAPVGHRVKRYGRNLVAGQIVFGRAGGAGSMPADPTASPLGEGRFLHRVIVHGHGRANRIVEYRLDGRRRRVEANGRVLSAEFAHGLGGSLIRIESRFGAVPELAYAGPTDAAPQWGAAHRLDGLVTSYIRCEQRAPADMQATYPRGPTELQVLGEFSLVFDPRLGRAVYTDNAALVMADWIESPDGFGATGALYVPDLIAAADRCDVLRQLANGGSLPSWRLAGAASLAEAPEAALRRMREACAADIRLRPDGTWSLNIGGDPDPVITLTEDDLLEVIHLDDGPGALRRYTTLPATYVDEALDYAETSMDPYVNEAEVARLGGEFIGGSVNLSMAPYHAQARHAAKIRGLRENPSRTARLRCHPSAIEAIYERTVRLDMPGFGLSGVWRVEPVELSVTDLTVTLQLSKIDVAAQGWSIAEEGQPLVLPPEAPDPDRPPAAPVGVQGFGDGAPNNAGILVVFDAPTDPQVSITVAISAAGAETWAPVTLGAGGLSARAGGLTLGALYDVAVIAARSVTHDPAAADATATILRNVTALDEVPSPGPVSSLAVVGPAGAGVVEITLSAPAVPVLRAVEVLRDGVVIARVRALPGARLRLSDTVPAGSFAWTAQAVSISGLIGPATPPVGKETR